jgi:peptidoglycan/LPS O-acetylase OafA/YrhL
MRINQSNTFFFKNLDALRFFAFLLVFQQHSLYNSFKPLETISPFLKKVINFFFLGGGTGVQFFFVLSGFLITYLIITEIRVTKKINIFNFYLRRFLRIWPLYYATVIFSFVIYPLLKSLIGINSDLCSRPLYYFTFLANFDSIHIANNCPGKDAMTQGIVWSVSIEEQFYLIWPLLFLIFPKRFYWLIFLIVIISSIIFRLNAEGAALYFHTFSVMGDLAIGGLMGYLFTKEDIIHKFRKIPYKINIVIYSIIFLLYFNPETLNYPLSEVFNRIIFDFFWAYIIIDQCFATTPIYNMGNFKTISNYGKISYGLYMLHPIAILVLDIIFRLLRINNEYLIFIKGILALPLSIFFAKISYKYLEIPFLKFKEKFSILKTR